ncbi:MAG: spore coat associated protein CotJA [Eubacteriales bacterium]|nr:spore coat associated protein CotJA [Eubacteriales bacterium]
MNNIESQVRRIRNDDEEPYVGMPLPGLGGRMREPVGGSLAGLPLAMAYVPWQCWYETYKPAESLHRGTIFPELDLPFLAGGDC